MCQCPSDVAYENTWPEFISMFVYVRSSSVEAYPRRRDRPTTPAVRLGDISASFGTKQRGVSGRPRTVNGGTL